MTHPRRTSKTWPIVVLAGVILALYLAREVMIPFALALTLTFLLTPAVMLLERLRVGRIASVLVVLVISMVALGGIGWVVGNQLLEVADDLPNYRQNVHNRIAAFHGPVSGVIGRATQNVTDITKELESATPEPAVRGKNTRPGRPTPVEVVTPPPNALQSLRQTMGSALQPAGMAGIVMVFTIFMLLKREDLRNRLLRLAGQGRINTMTVALDDAAQRISRYLGMQFLVNALFGLAFGFGLYLIGVPKATLWGVIAALFRIVPYAGSLVAAGLPLALSVVVFNTWTPPLLVCALFAGLELLITNLVEPWLYGVHTGISSLALLVTTVFWTALWGWAGLILSTPLTVCVIVLGRYVPQLSFLYILLGDEPVLDPHAHFYQRLLAMDQNEARAVADEYLKDHRLVDLYDQVVIPALSLAEQERHKGRLEDAREAFLFLGVTELVAELADHESAIAPEPAGGEGRVFCIPAKDQADEITASILAQLLEQAGIGAINLPVSAKPSDWSTEAPDSGDMIVISALPPFAFAPARSAHQQLRRQFPKVPVMLGLWSLTADAERTKARFGTHQPDRIATSMEQAVEQIREWREPKRVELSDPADSVVHHE